MMIKKKNQWKEMARSMLFLLPGLVLIIFFVIYPVINTFILSFQSWNGIANVAKEWVGFDNYTATFTNPKFWNAMKNSFYFLVGGFCLQMPLSFGMAMLVTSKLRFTRLFKMAYLMPVILGTAAVGLMWTFILNSDFGLLAEVMRRIGLDGLIIDWLSTPTVNIWCVVLVNVWMYGGYNMLIFAAGLVGIPSEIHDAAKIDGCYGLKKVINISLPLCKNMFMVYSVLCITGCLKTFDLVWAMTRGGPVDSSSTPAILLYTQGFQFRMMGRSSAISIILLVFGLVLSFLLNNVIFKQDENL